MPIRMLNSCFNTSSSWLLFPLFFYNFILLQFNTPWMCSLVGCHSITISNQQKTLPKKSLTISHESHHAFWESIQSQSFFYLLFFYLHLLPTRERIRNFTVFSCAWQNYPHSTFYNLSLHLFKCGIYYSQQIGFKDYFF